MLTLDGYNLIVDNDGNIVYSEYINRGMPVDLKVAPNGGLSYGIMSELAPFDVAAAGLTQYFLMDSTYAPVDSFQMGNDYIADFHEFQLLPNGHSLMLTYDLQPVDMSAIITGGYPLALVAGSIVQELDENKNVVFQWRSWDHYNLTDSYQNLTQPTINAIHLNSIEMSNDGHLIVSAVALAEITKINRQTGEIIWRMAGKNNEFTFINENQDFAPIYFMYQHDVRQLDNGNLTMLDNGNNNAGAGDLPIRPHTRALEYQIDETNMTVTNVWQYRHDPDILVGNMGNMQRLDNGNTVVGWGAASMTGAPLMTEVNTAGEVISELTLNRLLVTSYRVYRFEWDLGRHDAYVMRRELGKNNAYKFNDTDQKTGAMLVFSEGAALGFYNEVHIWKYEHGPHAPEFAGKAPSVLPQRIIIDDKDFLPPPFYATLYLDQAFFNFKNPDSIIIYHREFPDRGLFVPLPTSYTYFDPNPGYDDPDIDGWYVNVPMTKYGEYIVTYPDLQSMTFPPSLISPVNSAKVNQATPVSLKWTPIGVANWFHLQVATDSLFSNIITDADYLTSSLYKIENPSPSTTCYWRVTASNDAGTSDWSAVGAFTTTTPFITVTSPNGSESWERGKTYFIQWNDVIEDSIVIELYRNDVFVRSIGTAEGYGIYSWSIPTDIAIASDYKIHLKSTANDTITDMSDNNFSISEFTDLTSNPVSQKFNFTLAQNYPNPFNASTRISYSIPTRTHVTLKLYNIMGHEMKTLVNELQPSNQYSAFLDIEDLPGGIYLLHLSTGDNQIMTRKLILTK